MRTKCFREDRMQLLFKIICFWCKFLIPPCLLQQDSLISESELSQYFAHDVPGPLSDFVVAGSEDEDPPGSGCGSSAELPGASRKP